MKLPLANTDFTAFALAVLLLELLDEGLELVEMVNPVIGDSQRADLAGLLGFDESSPRTGTAFFAAIRRVYQISLWINQQPIGLEGCQFYKSM